MPPSSIEFLRYTRISRPLIIHGCYIDPYDPDDSAGLILVCCSLLKGMRNSALDKWNDDYLCTMMNDEVISVAVTPDGCVLSYTSYIIVDSGLEVMQTL